MCVDLIYKKKRRKLIRIITKMKSTLFRCQYERLDSECREVSIDFTLLCSVFFFFFAVNNFSIRNLHNHQLRMLYLNKNFAKSVH